MTIVPKYLMIEWMGDFFGFSAYAFDIDSVYKPAGYFTNAGVLVTDILKILVSLAGVVAFVFIIISGLKFVTSSGDEKKLDSAKSTLTFSIIGITVVIMSFVIIRIVQAFLGSNVGVVDEGTSGSGPPPAAGCTLSTGSVVAGEPLTVTSKNGLFGTIGMMGAYGTPVYSTLGTLSAGGSTPITVPAGAAAGLYVVRVGEYAVGCTPNLSVSAVATSTTFKNTAGATQRFGDVDGNGVIENTDKLIIQALASNLSVPPLTADMVKAADLDGNRAFTSADITNINNYLSDPINYKFPVYTYPSSCTYDFSYDGAIDGTDAAIVNDYFGKDVSQSYYYTIYDLSKDGRIDFNDTLDVLSLTGPC